MDRLLAKVFVASLVLCVTGGARGNMMRAVVYHGTPSQVIVTDVPMPTLQAETDAIVRITLAGICGTDLHMYHGLMGTNAPWVLGHEGVGYVVEAGRSVTALKVGDYVAIPDNVANGHLDMQTAAPNVFGVGRGLGGLQGEFLTWRSTLFDVWLTCDS